MEANNRSPCGHEQAPSQSKHLPGKSPPSTPSIFVSPHKVGGNNHSRLERQLMKRHLKSYTAVLVLALSLSAFAAGAWETASTEAELLQGLQGVTLEGHVYDCDSLKVDGNWAYANLTMHGGTSGSAMFSKQNGRWSFFCFLGGRGGPVARQDLISNGVPADVAALFGYGQVPANVIAALKAEGTKRKSHFASLAIYGSKVFACVRTDKYSNPGVIYEYTGGKWSSIFSYDSRQQNGLAVFKKYSLSEFMGGQILSGSAGEVSW